MTVSPGSPRFTSMKPKELHWIDAGSIVEAQTKDIEKEFRRSRLRPRASRMGFRPEPKGKPLTEDPFRI